MRMFRRNLDAPASLLASHLAYFSSWPPSPSPTTLPGPYSAASRRRSVWASLCIPWAPGIVAGECWPATLILPYLRVGGGLPTKRAVTEDEADPAVKLVPSPQAPSCVLLAGRAPQRALTSVGSGHSRTTTVGVCALRAVGSAGPERSEGASQARGSSSAGIGLAMSSRPMRSLVAEGPGSPRAFATREAAKTVCELSHLVMATSSDGVVLQGVQHPSGCVVHDLPLLVGQLCCSVLHDPGDPWQVMDHPWGEPLARRQERMLVVGERAAAGRAPRGGRCHGSEYGRRLGAGPPRGRAGSGLSPQPGCCSQPSGPA
jgi:hypothetical protein